MPLLDQHHLVELAWCRTAEQVGGTDIPTMASGRRLQAIVPPGKRWLVHRLELVNVDASTSVDASVWIVPEGEAISSSTVDHLWVAHTSIAVEERLIFGGDYLGQVIRSLSAGDSVWIMGGDADVLLLVLGWEVDACGPCVAAGAAGSAGCSCSR